MRQIIALLPWAVVELEELASAELVEMAEWAELESEELALALAPHMHREMAGNKEARCCN